MMILLSALLAAMAQAQETELAINGMTDDPRHGPALDQQWGLDAFGYRAKDSNEPGGPVFQWIDIETTGILVSGLADDNNVGPFPIGWDFQYYGNFFSQFWIGSNGYVKFQAAGVLAQPFPTFPSTPAPNDVIAPYVADWFFGPSEPSACYYWSNLTDTLIVMWTNVRAWQPGGNVGDHNFEVIFSGVDRSFTFMYGVSTTGDVSNNDIKIGFENATGQIGLQMYHNAYPPNNYAIKTVVPLGRCCYGDLSMPQCLMSTHQFCSYIEGNWTEELTCGSPCPNESVPQPDTIYYDDGIPALYYTPVNHWVRVRFTPLSCFELRSVYFYTMNGGDNPAPCSVFVHLTNGNSLGTLRLAQELPGMVPNLAWNDLELSSPLTFNANQEFFIVIGPVPGGTQFTGGWHVLLDNGTTTQRSGMSTAGHYFPYSTNSGGDLMIRAGGEYVESFRGAISLVNSGPPDWSYRLTHRQGCVSQVAFTMLCPGTTGSVSGNAAAGWSVLPNGDGNDGDSIIFVASAPLTHGSLTSFNLYHPYCINTVFWSSGDTSGLISGPLPVDLTSFEAVAGDNSVTLNWITGAEIQNDRFEILRDGDKVAAIPATNSPTGSHYSWTDNAAINGTTYTYTLTSVSIQGEVDELRTVEATPHRLAAVISESALHQNYPNPFNQTTSLTYDLKETGYVTLTMYNVIGQPVATLVNDRVMAGRHTVMFDAKELPSGIYFAQLRAGSFLKTEKMVLLK